MDRLQQAISKARMRREGAEAPAAGKPAHPERKERKPQAQGLSELDARWGEFEPLTIDAKTVTNNRLVAYSSGESSIPFDMLRTKILQQARKNKWKRIAICSPESGAGKTTVTVNLGLSFSRMREKRLTIMDFDMRRAGLSRALGQSSKTSMSDVLERRVPFADHGKCLEGNVVFGFNRERVKNPSEILQNPVTAQVLDEIESYYEPDIMIFDTPPLMVSDDSHGFLEQMDCALLIAAAEITSMDKLDVAERQLSELTNVMGIVLNRCRYTTGAHGYENEYY
ncbi:CpsD/CapB family tyrosine-protein kinase [Phaeobacter sp. 22II1-1F12B]|uniref:CpsD/CapB family tyrosine-protein kinase n=1 Tax=Phaeobacter sp. 22II1-1F12B TaxID=1317111 RepID=UPI000B527937|nr:CpsD/CapB family tyrosine-protein kinase [Phaeobacter sp. 22II1-1F12B]OWU80928.1 hypothetical protein ATO1_07400 [Phaeobacter sp. 22II1-1F12B]